MQLIPIPGMLQTLQYNYSIIILNIQNRQKIKKVFKFELDLHVNHSKLNGLCKALKIMEAPYISS